MCLLQSSPLRPADSLLNAPPGCPRPKETLRHPPGRTQRAAEGGCQRQGEREKRDGAGERGREPAGRIARDCKSQQASLPQRTTAVLSEAAAGECAHTQVRSWFTVFITTAVVMDTAKFAHILTKLTFKRPFSLHSRCCICSLNVV